LLFTATCFAEELPTTIISDSLDYDKETSTYIAKGSVKVQQGVVTIEAIEMKYNEKTSDVFAEGDVRYDTPDVFIKAERAEYNMNAKTGKFYNAEVFSKHDNFHVSGPVMEKRGEKEYFLEKATATTCDGPSPAWCFKGSKVDIIIGDRLTSRNTTFNIKGLPVLYTPYLWAPVKTERKTGFLPPVLGYSRLSGLFYRQPFFWAIDEDKDATFNLDWYGKRGFGEGVEYRYVGLGGVEGKNWLYHLYDRKIHRSIYEIKAANEKRTKDNLSAYMNLNLVNDENFYRIYSIHRDERITRFLESTAEISLPVNNSRIYLMSQYLIDLKEESHNSEVAQRLPEGGFTVNPQRIGPAVFSLTSSVAKFSRERGTSGQRFDLYPKLAHSFGDKVVLSQYLGLRETIYYLEKNEAEGFKDLVQRDTFDYNITASSRITKQYASFTHAVEPSLGYTFVPWLKRDTLNVPVFDSTESYSKQSTIGLSIVNRFLDKKGEFFTLNISESFNSYNGDRPLSPISIAASLSRPLSMQGDASYNPNSGRLESLNSRMTINFHKIAVSIGERYSDANNTLYYDAGINYTHSKNLSAGTRFWYDDRQGELRDVEINMNYQRQCWGMIIAFNRKPPDKVNNTPSDYSIRVTFNLLGLGSYKLGI